MKVSIGYRIKEGPWGGGNLFVKALSEALINRGHEVYYDLKRKDLDIIILFDPRSRQKNIPFSSGTILRYLLFRNKRAIVVHRVNECDERKNTRHMNKMLLSANYCADHTVFISSWLTGLNVWKDNLTKSHSVILNGADHRTFNAVGQRPWNGSEPMKIVTHHWGAHWMKGFDIYSRIDEMLANPLWNKRIAFTYIGNLPSSFRFHNTRYLLPMDTESLAFELRTHHVYLTASLNEPAGMHHIEGAMSGLPLIYRKSGALPEYCNGFGVGFDENDFSSALQRMLGEYAHYRKRISEYDNTADRMCANYIGLFTDLIARRDEIIAGRRLWKNPLFLLGSQIPI